LRHSVGCDDDGLKELGADVGDALGTEQIVQYLHLFAGGKRKTIELLWLLVAELGHEALIGVLGAVEAVQRPLHN
jgi:hypothetical protein